MDINTFMKLPEFGIRDDITVKKGQYFIYGERLTAQKNRIKPGSLVTVYEVIYKNGKEMVYKPVQIKLDKEKEK